MKYFSTVSKKQTNALVKDCYLFRGYRQEGERKE